MLRIAFSTLIVDGLKTVSLQRQICLLDPAIHCKPASLFICTESPHLLVQMYTITCPSVQLDITNPLRFCGAVLLPVTARTTRAQVYLCLSSLLSLPVWSGLPLEPGWMWQVDLNTWFDCGEHPQNQAIHIHYACKCHSPYFNVLFRKNDYRDSKHAPSSVYLKLFVVVAVLFWFWILKLKKDSQVKRLEQPTWHQLMDGWRKCGPYSQWTTIKPCNKWTLS